MFPENIVRATFQQVQTKYTKESVKITIDNMSYYVLNETHFDRKPELEFKDGMNVLGVWRDFVKLTVSTVN